MMGTELRNTSAPCSPQRAQERTPYAAPISLGIPITVLLHTGSSAVNKDHELQGLRDGGIARVALQKTGQWCPAGGILRGQPWHGDVCSAVSSAALYPAGHCPRAAGTAAALTAAPETHL